MTESWRRPLLIWSEILGLLALILVFQTALWPHALRFHGFTIQFTLPILLYLSLHSSLIFTLSLFYGISILSTGFITAPFANIFATYLFIYTPTLISRDLYQWKEFRFFFMACFIWAVLFPLILDVLSRFASQPYFTALPFHFIMVNAFLTSGWGALLYPILNQLKQKQRL